MRRYLAFTDVTERCFVGYIWATDLGYAIEECARSFVVQAGLIYEDDPK